MKRDSKLSAVLHVLLHMAEMNDPVTSESLAAAMHTNPVVVRRLMAGLRQAGFVSSAKGHGGGWVLSCSLAAVTLGDIHNAVGAPALLAMGNRTESLGLHRRAGRERGARRCVRRGRGAAAQAFQQHHAGRSFPGTSTAA